VRAIITPPASVDTFSTSAKLHVRVDIATDRIADMDQLELFLHEKIISHLRLTKGPVSIASDPLSECFLDTPFAVSSPSFQQSLHTGFPALGLDRRLRKRVAERLSSNTHAPFQRVDTAGCGWCIALCESISSRDH